MTGICLLVFALMIATGIWFRQVQSLSPIKNWTPKYLALENPFIPPPLTAKTSQAINDGKSVQAIEDIDDIEEITSKVLYDRLEDQNLQIASQIKQHQNELDNYYKKMEKEINKLNKMIERIKNNDTAEATSSPSRTNTGVDNTQVGSSSKQDFNISPQTMTVSYVSQQDRTMMEGIQQMLNHLNGGNVTITDAMVNEVLSRIRKENIDTNGDNALELQRIKKIELEKELYEAESLELAELMAEIDEKYEIKYSELNDEMNTLLNNASNDDQRAKIIADYDQLRNKLCDEHNNERAKRLEELRRRLAERRMEKVNQFNDENKLILATVFTFLLFITYH